MLWGEGLGGLEEEVVSCAGDLGDYALLLVAEQVVVGHVGAFAFADDGGEGDLHLLLGDHYVFDFAAVAGFVVGFGDVFLVVVM